MPTAIFLTTKSAKAIFRQLAAPKQFLDLGILGQGTKPFRPGEPGRGGIPELPGQLPDRMPSGASSPRLESTPVQAVTVPTRRADQVNPHVGPGALAYSRPHLNMSSFSSLNFFAPQGRTCLVGTTYFLPALPCQPWHTASLFGTMTVGGGVNLMLGAPLSMAWTGLPHHATAMNPLLHSCLPCFIAFPTLFAPSRLRASAHWFPCVAAEAGRPRQGAMAS